MAGSKSKSGKKKTNQTAGGDTFKKIIAVIAGVAVFVVLELCNFSVLGTAGLWIRYAMFGLFGAMAYVLPVLLAGIIIYVNCAKPVRLNALIGYVLIFIFLCVFVRLVSGGSIITEKITDYFTVSASELNGGGIFGGLIGFALYKMLDKAGAIIVTIFVILILVVVANKEPITALIDVLTGNEDEREREKEERARLRAEEKEEREARGQRTAAPARIKSGEKNRVVRNTSSQGNGETVITIKRTSRKSGRRKTTILIRSRNKARPLRDGTVSALGGESVRGLGSNLSFSDISSSDETREITGKYDTDEPAREILSDADNTASEILAGEERKQPENPASTEGKQSESLVGAEGRQSEPLAESGKSAAKKQTSSSKKNKFKTPPISIFRQAPKMKSSGSDLAATAKLLEEVLSEFGVNAKVINAQAGPSVVRYELQPEIGTRVSKITSLADDLKLNLAVPDIRIEAPIPGRAAVGIEVPSKIRKTVYVRELLESKELKGETSKLAFAAGMDISGAVITADIAKMPHMLIAGTTGSGKSVFINSILMSILYRTTPSEVGLIIIDPKAVEFSVYRGIPNLVKDVVTDPGQAVSTLRWAVNEMTVRYQRMQLSGVRDFESYNRKFESGTLNPDEENASRMPQILIVIDELADLMMVASKEAESLICRLAQLARAAGIYLVIATQRPSVDVVTGLIKANIPARVALLVSSGVDSRTIIDMNGAEKLLGHGDMLFYPTGYTKPVRLQGAYVSDDEIRETVNFLKNQGQGEAYYAREAEEIERFQSGEAGASSGSGKDDEAPSGKDKYDEYFFDAGLLCIEHGKASSSMLQRQFNIGFNRAARIIDQMEELGAVGPQNGAKPREILVDSITFREMWDSL